MTDGRYFGHLRLRGGRYELGGLPLSGVGELSRYQSLLKTVAKALFLSDHPERRRVPKGFLSTEILLAKLGKGSVMTYFDEVATSTAPAALDEQDKPYLLQAQRVINEFLRSVQDHAEPAHRQLALDCADAFAAMGKSLAKDESIEFYEKRYAVQPRARLDRTVRDSLQLFLAPLIDPSPPSDEILGERTFYGHVSGLRSLPKAFDLLTEEAGQLEASFVNPDGFRILQNVLGPGDRAPLVAIGALVDESGSIVDVLNVESVLPSEWQERLEHLARLEVDWLEPGSPPPSEASLRLTEQVLLVLLDDAIARPGIFPEGDGGVQLEWSTGAVGSGVEVLISNEGAVTLFRFDGTEHVEQAFPDGTDSRTIAAAVRGALP
jgi:hypothetical protein